MKVVKILEVKIENLSPPNGLPVLPPYDEITKFVEVKFECEGKEDSVSIHYPEVTDWRDVIRFIEDHLRGIGHEELQRRRSLEALKELEGKEFELGEGT